MKQFVNAAKKALNDTTLYMTAEVRSHAQQSGWDSDAVNSLRVINNNGSIDVISSNPDRVKDMEYGNEFRRPNAALRQYANRPQKAEEMFAKRMNRYVRGY